VTRPAALVVRGAGAVSILKPPKMLFWVVDRLDAIACEAERPRLQVL
jgi:hypothetical protein